MSLGTSRRLFPATRLTQAHCGRPKRARPTYRPPSVCRRCGAPITLSRSSCASCAVAVSREGLIEAAKLGREAGHSHEARARQAEKLRRHAAEVKAWSPSEQLGWLTVEVYLEKIQPHLAGITVAAISSALDISQPYAAEILRRSICAASTPLADGRRLHGSSSTQRKSEIAKQKRLWFWQIHNMPLSRAMPKVYRAWNVCQNRKALIRFGR